MSENVHHRFYPSVVVTLFLFLCSPRMDFLVLFLFYLALVLIGVVTICICSKTHYLRGLVRGGAQVTTMLGDHWIVTTTSKRLTGSLMEQNTDVIFIHLFTSFIYGSYGISESLWGFFCGFCFLLL